MVKCSNCGQKNIEGSKYCNQCAYPLNAGKISLGRYEDIHQGFPYEKKYADGREYIEDQSLPFQTASGVTSSSDDGIYDRDRISQKPKKSIVLKMTLVIMLALFVFVAYNGVKFAVDTQQDRITQAEIKKEQQAQAEELKLLENYREKFNSVIVNYEEQGVLIENNISSLTTLRINRFAKGLGLGDVFNKLVNSVLDVSKVNELKEKSATLDILVGELINPPETYLAKYETLGLLKNVENQITETISGTLTSQTKGELEKLSAEYQNLLTDIKR